MIKMLQKLWHDRRGNALVIAGAALPLVVGSAGLASDTVHWALWKRQLQRAADSAALAGVYARAQEASYTNAVVTDLDRNNQVVPDLLGSPTITTPADTADWTHHVKVDLAVQKTLGFSSLFLSTAPIIRASATAAMIPDGNYCVVALARTGTGIDIGGSANVNMGCGAIANSSDSTSSVDTNGTAYSFVADPVASAGGMPSSINGATDLQPFHVPMPDPFKNKYDTDVPPGTPCSNFNQHVRTETTGTGQNRVTTTHLSNGCYSSFSAGNGTFYLDPGVYYLDSTSLNLSGQTILIGTDVTIILTGADPGSISMSGNSEIQITAPTSGPYAKMAIIQSSTATAGNNNIINGDNNTFIDGAIYFPSGDMNFTGSSANSTRCAMIVSLTVEFSGNTNIQNDTTGCVADQTVTGKRIRLVA